MLDSLSVKCYKCYSYKQTSDCTQCASVFAFAIGVFTITETNINENIRAQLYLHDIKHSSCSHLHSLSYCNHWAQTWASSHILNCRGHANNQQPDGGKWTCLSVSSKTIIHILLLNNFLFTVRLNFTSDYMHMHMTHPLQNTEVNIPVSLRKNTYSNTFIHIISHMQYKFPENESFCS